MPRQRKDFRLLDSLLEGCQLISPDYSYLYVNEAAARQARMDREELLGRSMAECFPGIDSTPMFERLARCMDTGEPDQLINEFTYPDGSVACFDLLFERVPEGVFVLSIDFTRLKHTEAELRRRNQTLALLSECNQAVVHASSVEKLIARVAETAVSRGGCLLAAVLLGVEGEKSRLELATHSHSGTLSGDRAEQVLEHCVDRARRLTGQHHDGAVLYRWPAAKPGESPSESGQADALLMLPLVYDGSSLGVLTLYGPEAETFSGAQRELLDEVALDLGFGIGTLRGRQARIEAEVRGVETRRKLETLLGNLPGMAYRSANDRHSTLELVSDGCIELTGYTAQELEEQQACYGNVVHPDDRDAVRTSVRDAVEAREPYVLEYRIIDKEGRLKWVWEKGVAVVNPQGEVEALEGFTTDITDRKQAERDVGRLNERLQLLTRVVQRLSSVRDLDGVSRLASRAARDLSGADGATLVLKDGDQCHYVAEDAISPLWQGKRFPLTDCISGWAMIHREPAVIEDIYEDDRVPHEAYRSTFVESLVMAPIRTDDPVGALGAYWATRYKASDDDVRILQALADSTSVAIENLRFLDELESERARVKTIHDHLPLPTFVWAPDGGTFVLTDVNEAARSITGEDADSLLGLRAEDFEGAIPGLPAHLERCYRERAQVRAEATCKFPGRSDERRLVLTYGRVPADLVVLHAEDVTELRATEKQLRLSQRLEAVGQLAGGIAHDFNNLLTVILGSVGFAMEELSRDATVWEDLEEIHTSAVRAASLTRQLLAFSRKQVLEPEILDLNQVLQGTESLLRRLIGEHIEVKFELTEALDLVETDPSQIEQVVMNLAVNARDAMPTGGHLLIETRNASLDQDYADSHPPIPPGDYVQIAVTDTGHGMDQQTRERIFEPFFTTKEMGKGTGLGLATVYGIVKQSGGFIWVYSEPGEGTTFKIFLPRVEASAPTLPTKQAASKDSRGTETLLVVEDETGVLRLTERALRRCGYRVASASSGDEALELRGFLDQGLDLLITDVVMPGISGLELADELSRQFPSLRVLFTSGYTESGIVQHGRLAADAHFLAKPFRLQDLTRKVREILDEENG